MSMTAKKKPRGSAKARRSAARLAAVQVLYEIAQTGKTAAECLAGFIEYRIGHEVDGATFVPADVTLLSAIVRGADSERAPLDGLIESAIRPPLERERLELLLRVIVVAGAWELRRTPGASHSRRICRHRDRLLWRRRARLDQRDTGPSCADAEAI
jgi:N utilization substance protein B